MEKFAFDFQELDQSIARQKIYKLADVKNKITKVAFDVVKFHDSDDLPKGLWQVHSADDGEFLVAMYEEPELKTEAKSDWTVVKNATASHLNIFYKNSPVAKLASAELGFDASEIDTVCASLEDKLQDNKFSSLLLRELPSDERTAVIARFPELGK